MVAIHKWGCGVKQDNPGDVLHQCGLWWRGQDWQGLGNPGRTDGKCGVPGPSIQSPFTANLRALRFPPKQRLLQNLTGASLLA